MILKKDPYFLTFRLLFISFGILFVVCVGKSFFYKEEALFTLANEMKLLVGALIIALCSIMPHTIELKNKTITIKNVFGIIIKKFSLKKIKGRKVKYNYIPSSINMLFFKKYDRHCQIKYIFDKGSYSFNAHILSDTGLNPLYAKPKNSIRVYSLVFTNFSKY